MKLGLEKLTTVLDNEISNSDIVELLQGNIESVQQVNELNDLLNRSNQLIEVLGNLQTLKSTIETHGLTDSVVALANNQNELSELLGMESLSITGTNKSEMTEVCLEGIVDSLKRSYHAIIKILKDLYLKIKIIIGVIFTTTSKNIIILAMLRKKFASNNIIDVARITSEGKRFKVVSAADLRIHLTYLQYANSRIIYFLHDFNPTINSYDEDYKHPTLQLHEVPIFETTEGTWSELGYDDTTIVELIDGAGILGSSMANLKVAMINLNDKINRYTTGIEKTINTDTDSVSLDKLTELKTIAGNTFAAINNCILLYNNSTSSFIVFLKSLPLIPAQ